MRELLDTLDRMEPDRAHPDNRARLEAGDVLYVLGNQNGVLLVRNRITAGS